MPTFDEQNLKSLKRRLIILILLLIAGGLTIGTPMLRAQTIIDSLRTVDDKNSLETAINFAELWHQVSCCLVKSNDVEAALDFWGNAAREFDFKQVYESGVLRNNNQNKSREIRFLGERRPNAYQLSIDQTIGNSRTIPASAEFGEGQLTLGLRKSLKNSQGNDIYDVAVNGQAQLQGLKPSGFLDSAKQLLVLLSLRALAARKMNVNRPTLFPKLDAASRAYMDQYTTGLPGFTKLGTKYFKVISVFQDPPKVNPAVSRVSFKMGLNSNAIARDFPDLHAYLESLRGVLKSEFELCDSDNRTLMKGRVDSASQISSLEFYVIDGKLIPQNPNKTFAMNALIDIADRASRDYKLYTRSTIEIMGLKMDTGRTHILVKTSFDGGEIQATSKILKITQPSVTGRMFHILPTWLIDVTIPGDIQERVNRFAKILSNTRNGQGAEGILKIPATHPHLAQISGHAELLDNNILKLGLKVGVDTLLPKESAQQDIRRIDESLSSALINDLRALAPKKISDTGSPAIKNPTIKTSFGER
jgi:hypothetical protein